MPLGRCRERVAQTTGNAKSLGAGTEVPGSASQEVWDGFLIRDSDVADLRGRVVRGRGCKGAWLEFGKRDAAGLGQLLAILR